MTSAIIRVTSGVLQVKNVGRRITKIEQSISPGGYGCDQMARCGDGTDPGHDLGFTFEGIDSISWVFEALACELHNPLSSLWWRVL